MMVILLPNKAIKLMHPLTKSMEAYLLAYYEEKIKTNNSDSEI